MIVRWGAAAVSLCLIGGCGGAGSDGRDRDPANQPGYVRPVATAEAASHRVRGGDVSGSAATFALVNGVDVVRVKVADLGGDLFEVATPDGARVAPAVSVDGNDVVAGLRDTRDGGPAVVTVVLSSSVRWQVRLAGGAADETVDLTGGPGGDVDLTSGTSRAAVVLPTGKGTQRVVMSGGAGQLSVRLGGSAPARVAAQGGAGSVTVDGATHSGVAGGSVWTPAGWDSATDRYDIDATAGVSAMIVDRA